jgi:hypothetical protein
MWQGPEANGKISFKISEHWNTLLVPKPDSEDEKKLQLHKPYEKYLFYSIILLWLYSLFSSLSIHSQ